MAILVCRVAWMPSYKADDEPARGGGSYVDEGNMPHESLNFLPVDGTYYGYVMNDGQKLSLERLGSRKADQKTNGVLVVFCATNPKTGKQLVTGWYTDATVYRLPIKRPEDRLDRDAYFTATNAVLVAEAERRFRIPGARDKPRRPFGGIGQSNIWYGLNEDSSEDFRESLNKYMSDVESGMPVKRREMHPLNQILYGPPGTGKTWNAVKHAMAVVTGAGLDEIDDEDRGQFHALRFDPKTRTGQIAMVTFHQSFSYEDFVEGIRPRLDGEKVGYELRDGIFKRIANAARKDEDPEKRYVLIIDEINRGNIPKIFGELITLVEDSKRLGKADGMSVILPYSNEDFGVPSKLYIIGTMNTADRSILLLDTALRRRFDFVEMMPKLDHKRISANVGGVELRKLLKAMNERISLLLDREHQIGHTYLFGVTDLKSLSDKFQNKIFPLLQECFYDDWSKIREVLGGAGFVSEQKLGYARRLRSTEFVDEDRSIYERLPNDDRKWTDPDEYKKIYSDGSGIELS